MPIDRTRTCEQLNEYLKRAGNVKRYDELIAEHEARVREYERWLQEGRSDQEIAEAETFLATAKKRREELALLRVVCTILLRSWHQQQEYRLEDELKENVDFLKPESGLREIWGGGSFHVRRGQEILAKRQNLDASQRD